MVTPLDGMVSPENVAAFAGLIVAFLAIFLIVGLAIYIYSALALMKIANKTNTKNVWLAWIPIANIYLMTQIAKVSGLWTLAIIVSFIPYIGMLAFIVFAVWIWWKISEARGFPGWFGLLQLVPIVNLIILGVVAWGEPK
jgi:hypothetical protein